MNEYLNPIAELDEPDSGQLITPEQAYRLKVSRHFFCPDFDCRDKKRVLIPVISPRKNYFFRHRGDFKHDIRPETLLHKSAIKWFQGKTKFEIPAIKSSTLRLPQQTLILNPEKTECEYRKLRQVIPDVKLLTVNGFEFALEIFVTSDVTLDKRKRIQDFGLPVVRIDLSRFYKKHPKECRVDLEFINSHLEALLTDIDLKSWVIAPTPEVIEGKLERTVAEIPVANLKTEPSIQEDSHAGCVLVILTLGLVYLFRPKRK